VDPIIRHYSITNSRGFALESVCASKRQTGRHFEGQLNLVERPTTAVSSRTHIRTVDALSCAGANCQLSVVNHLYRSSKSRRICPFFFLSFFFFFLFLYCLIEIHVLISAIGRYNFYLFCILFIVMYVIFFFYNFPFFQVFARF